ncbi:MAG: molybdopterin/thiamine biosynthesis adenylyltransferase/rhodanese-related sulfurtransferase [Polyangiales bacterium]|jgi:molybdopterin/thiamine biosynthesis adenylyltransferase/rhodanese-related sulfurtransferase
MAKTYVELLQDVKASVTQVTLESLHERMTGEEELTLVDVREKDEWRQGHIPGALHLPRGFLEMQAQSRLPKRDAKIIVYCAGGIRSAFAAKALMELGYTNVETANPGFNDWKDKGYPQVKPFAFTDAQLNRYSRHLLLPEVGEKGQAKLLQSRVLLLGAGGLGSPAALYLAAAGVGTLGIVDGDTVDESNLQRQVLHGRSQVDRPKVQSAVERITDLNPDVTVIPFQERLDSSNVDRIFDQGWDVIVDGLDNFPTRYLVNDASVFKDIPVVHGSIFRFDGQATTFWPQKGPCYRCLYPEPPPPHLAPSCAEAGVLGVLPGVIGTIQATEAIKILLGIGQPLVGRLLQYDSLTMKVRTFKLPKDPECAVCGSQPTITSYIDYEGFCAG